jgi:hypothetical protein
MSGGFLFYMQLMFLKSYWYFPKIYMELMENGVDLELNLIL